MKHHLEGGEGGGDVTTVAHTQKDRINAEFSVTKSNVGIYVGDITFSAGNFSSAGKVSISQDSNAARDFFRQSGIKLLYTEAIMEMNR